MDLDRLKEQIMNNETKLKRTILSKITHEDLIRDVPANHQVFKQFNGQEED